MWVGRRRVWCFLLAIIPDLTEVVTAAYRWLRQGSAGVVFVAVSFGVSVVPASSQIFTGGIAVGRQFWLPQTQGIGASILRGIANPSFLEKCVGEKNLTGEVNLMASRLDGLKLKIGQSLVALNKKDCVLAGINDPARELSPLRNFVIERFDHRELAQRGYVDGPDIVGGGLSSVKNLNLYFGMGAGTEIKTARLDGEVRTQLPFRGVFRQFELFSGVTGLDSSAASAGFNLSFASIPESVGGKPKPAGKNDEHAGEYNKSKFANLGIAPKPFSPILFFWWFAFCVISSIYLASVGYSQIESGRWIGLLPLWGSVLLAGLGTIGIFLIPLVLQ
jgi:hypothetical protein